MKFRAIIIAILLIALLFFQQGCQIQDGGLKECFTDGDCSKIQITCCPCAIGGTEMCVSETLAPLYMEKLKSCPPENERLCMANDNCKIRMCACVNGTCKEK